MKNYRLLCLLMVGMVIGAQSCSQDSYSLEKPEIISDIKLALSPSRSYEEVVSIASEAKGKFYPQTKVASVEIKDVIPYCNSATKSSQSDTLLYIVNYANDEGFALIATSRAVDPILVVTESGSFDGTQTDCEPFNMYFEELSGQLAMLPGGPGSGGGDQPIFQPDIVDTSIFTYYTKQPMLETSWGQSEPFNYCTEYVGSSQAPAGCVPVAVGQVMAYYEYPSSLNLTYPYAPASVVFNWDDMKTHTATPSINCEICLMQAHLMREIGYRGGISYSLDESTMPVSNIPTVLYSFGYNGNVSDYYISNVVDALSANRPVLIAGSKYTYSSQAHMWVIDGYRHEEYCMDYYYPGNFNNNMTPIWADHVHVNQYFLHFVMGQNGSFDGYYTSYRYVDQYGEMFVDGGFTGIEIGIFAERDEANIFNKSVRVITNMSPNN